MACRYEKYDKPMDKRRVTNGDDPFQDELENMEAQVADLNKVCQLQCDWKSGVHDMHQLQQAPCAGRDTQQTSKALCLLLRTCCLQQAEEIVAEKNRAIAAARNADIRSACSPSPTAAGHRLQCWIGIRASLSGASYPMA